MKNTYIYIALGGIVVSAAVFAFTENSPQAIPPQTVEQAGNTAPPLQLQRQTLPETSEKSELEVPSENKNENIDSPLTETEEDAPTIFSEQSTRYGAA